MKQMTTLGLSQRDAKTYTMENGVEQSFTSEARFMMALYWGTESSQVALMEGNNMTEADVFMVMSDLTPEQLEMVNKVWEINESVWPELSAASIRRYGVAPPKLDPTPFEINGVQMTGGHMRLFYDSERIEKKIEQKDAENIQSVMPTKAGSLHARVGGGGQTVKLYADNIARALSENIHFIAFAELSSDVSIVLHNKKVRQAIERKHGAAFWNALTDNIKNITSNRKERESLEGIAKVVRTVRHAATMKHLAYSIRNTVQQVTALAPIIDEVGVVPFTDSLMRIFMSGDSGVQTKDFINQRSEFMRNRTSLVNREAAEHLRKITITGRSEYLWTVFKEYGFTPQQIVDGVFAYPTWLAKYEQEMMEHGDEKKAISNADTAVAETVGSGSDVHLGGMYQSANNEWVKLFTVFGSWFNAYYQRVYKSTASFSTFDKDAFRAVVTTPIILAVGSAALVMDFPDEDEGWFEWMAKSYAGFMFGMIPYVRDMVGAFSGFTPKNAITSGQETPYKVMKEFQDIWEEEGVSLDTAIDIGKGVTTFVPVPGSGQILRLADFVESNRQGEETGSPLKKTYQAFVEGPDRND
jgi:hypothetical protein